MKTVLILYFTDNCLNYAFPEMVLKMKNVFVAVVSSVRVVKL